MRSFKRRNQEATDDFQVKGIDVAPLNVEVWGIEQKEQQGKEIYSFKLERQNSNYPCIKNLNMQMVMVVQV
jgi:hypothetical protein